MKTIPLYIAAALAAITAHATPFIFDVNRNDFGIGSFTIDLPATWSGVDWAQGRDFVYLNPTQSQGSFFALDASDPTSNTFVEVPWKGLQVAFGSSLSFPANPPLLDIASLWAFTDPKGIWSGANLGPVFGEFASTPVAAVDGIGGVSLRVPVPEAGSTILLLLSGFALLAGLRALTSRPIVQASRS